jgi:hypothetical protein
MNGETPAVKPGFKTSEFWISALAVIYSTLVGTGIIPHSSEIQAFVSAAGALLVALGYTWARSWIKTVGCLLLLTGLALAGAGCTFIERDAQLNQARLELANYQGDTQKCNASTIAFYRAEMRAQVDQLTTAALAAETKPDGTAVAANVVALKTVQTQKYQLIEEQCAALAAKFAAIDQNGSNAQARLAALTDYLKSSTTSAQLLQQTAQGAADTVISILTPKPAAAAAAAK